MDFMEHLAQYLNRTLALAMLALTVLYIHRNTPDFGRIKLNEKDTGLQQQAGILYYRGQAFTGRIFRLYPNGDTTRLSCYYDGKQDGEMLGWYPGKKQAEKRFFEDGNKTGIARGWWPNGQQKFEYHFANDEYEGAVTEWFANGKLFRLFHYIAGHETGSQKMWWEDGTIRANYVIADGQKFGLFGQKLCTNSLAKINKK
jgi:antitoxin component YwqK of YwqJK toxin-antitoxin module